MVCFLYRKFGIVIEWMGCRMRGCPRLEGEEGVTCSCFKLLHGNLVGDTRSQIRDVRCDGCLMLLAGFGDAQKRDVRDFGILFVQQGLLRA
jgi:hypothetical protein